MPIAQIVNTCVDSLDVRVCRNLRPSHLTRRIFEIYRDSIRDALPHERQREYIDLPDVGRFEIGYSSRPYELVLKNPELCYIRIANVDKWLQFGQMELGQLYISIRSIFLQLKPLYFVRVLIDQIERALFYKGVPKLYHIDGSIIEFQRVSRMDVAADVASQRALRNSDLDQFVCRSRNDAVIYSMGKLTQEQLNDLVEEKIESAKRPRGGQFSNNPPRNPRLQKETGEIMGDSSEIFTIPDTSYVNRVIAPYLSRMREVARGLPPQKTSKFLVERVHSQSRKPQTVYFGTFKSQVFAKIYNKLSSLILQNKEYMMMVWLGNGWVPEVYPEVFRVEVSISGDFLRRVKVRDKVLDLRDLDEALEAVPMIWQYFSRNWLRQVDGNIDSLHGNKHSAELKTTRYWTVVQNAFTSDLEMSRFNSRGKILYKNRADLQKKADKLVRQAVGCFASAAAIMKGAKIDVTDDNKPFEEELDDSALRNIMLAEFFHQWAETSNVEERVNRIGLDPVTDTSLAAMSRAQMIEDEGSS